MTAILREVDGTLAVLFGEGVAEQTHMKAGDQINLEISPNGTITITPIRSQPSPNDVSRIIQETMRDYAVTMKKLA